MQRLDGSNSISRRAFAFGGFPFIEANTFSYNRHAIAGTTSIPKTGYRAWFNLVLSGVRTYNLHKTHDFDVH